MITEFSEQIVRMRCDVAGVKFVDKVVLRRFCAGDLGGIGVSRHGSDASHANCSFRALAFGDVNVDMDRFIRGGSRPNISRVATISEKCVGIYSRQPSSNSRTVEFVFASPELSLLVQ